MAERVLVTGGAGFIGSHVVRRLLLDGHHVAVVDNLSTGSFDNVPDSVRLYRVDICDREIDDVLEEERPTVVCHYAAHVSVPGALRDPAEDARVNILGSVRVAVGAVRHGARKLIYASSGGAVYGEPRYMPVDEDHPTRPMSPYGLSKLTAEEYLKVLSDLESLDYTVLRFANVYGPGQTPHGEAGVVSIFANNMMSGGQCFIRGDGTQSRDFVFAGDCADANAIAVDDAGRNQVFNVSSGVAITVNDLFERLASLAQYELAAVHGPAVPGEVHSIALDYHRVRTHLGWSPTVDLATGLRETLAWMRLRPTELEAPA